MITGFCLGVVVAGIGVLTATQLKAIVDHYVDQKIERARRTWTWVASKDDLLRHEYNYHAKQKTKGF